MEPTTPGHTCSHPAWLSDRPGYGFTTAVQSIVAEAQTRAHRGAPVGAAETMQGKVGCRGVALPGDNSGSVRRAGGAGVWAARYEQRAGPTAKEKDPLAAALYVLGTTRSECRLMPSG
jgi:hypothetical protein